MNVVKCALHFTENVRQHFTYPSITSPPPSASNTSRYMTALRRRCVPIHIAMSPPGCGLPMTLTLLGDDVVKGAIIVSGHEDMHIARFC